MNGRAKRICKLASGLVLAALVVSGVVLVVGTATAPHAKAWDTLPVRLSDRRRMDRAPTVPRPTSASEAGASTVRQPGATWSTSITAQA